MKTLKLISGVLFLLVLSYLVSCDITNQENVTADRTTSDNSPTTFICPNANGCGGVHFCLVYHTDPEVNTTLDPETISGIYVYQSGKDCANQDFICNYYTELSTAYSMGSLLPIQNSYVTFTRSIVICCSEGPYWSWEGTMTINYYPGYEGGLDILIHPTYKKC